MNDVRSLLRIGRAALLAVILGSACASGSQPLFERVFGVSRVLDPATVAAVKALPAGKTLPIDRNGDGKTDELWYLDTAKRQTIQPLLVRVIDEDGDMAADGRGDRDSDLYFWDWNADGTVDAVTDYQDDDGDNDVDEMGIFFNLDHPAKDGKPSITVWWGVDVGDDNLLWYDVNGTYYQDRCQYRCHFSGDEMFYQFRLTEDAPEWLNVFEDPFAFYDPDGDTCSEMVVRICAKGEEVENLRYSLDADGDARGRRTHDYDFSVTALPGADGITTAGAAESPLRVRGIPTHPVLAWGNTPAFARSARWGRTLLTWDEINVNTDESIDRDSHERWEGVLNHASRNGDFPQVGGPPSSPFNKRVEVSEHPALPLRLYYDASDRRLHLLGAGYGYIEVDYNLDGTVDARYDYEDRDADGILDRRRIDLDADGTPEFDWPMSGKVQELDLTYESVSPFYRDTLTRTLEESQRFIDVAKRALGASPRDPVEAFFLDELPACHPEREVGLHARTSPAGARYYVDLVRDRLFFGLKQKFGGLPDWPAVEDAYARGDYLAATGLVSALSGADADSGAEKAFGKFTRRIPVVIDNSGQAPRDAWPVVLRVSELVQVAPDFNPANCAVVAPQRWLDWFEVPHQVDSLDAGAGEELSFLAGLPDHGSATYYLYYAPGGVRRHGFPRLTGAVLDTPAYVAWESDAGAYRFYTGQFDFFGKQADRGLPRSERLLYPIVGENYHVQQAWGMDALHVGTTSGLGGLTLHCNGQTYLVQSPAGNGHVGFKHRVLSAGPVRAAVEITADHIVPGDAGVSAKLVCLIYAGHQESEVRASIAGLPSPFEFSVGLVKLDGERSFVDREAGTLGNWGFQEEGIGEVGLAIMVPPDRIEDTADLEHERQWRCQAPGGQLRYWILGDWRRGRQYPVSPSIDTWRREVTEVAVLLDDEPPVSLAAAEDVTSSR